MSLRRSVLLAIALVPVAAQAEDPHQGHVSATPSPTSHDWHGPLPTVEDTRRADTAASAASYRAASERMHREMDVALTGEPDRDFLATLVPYGEGGLAMARVALRQARDPEVRALAEGIVRSREEELEAWRRLLARLPARQ